MKRRWLLALVLFLSACRAQTTPTPVSTAEVHLELMNIPVYPKSSAWTKGIPGVDTPEGYQVYSYVANTFKSETLVKFYEENMPSNGWELFSKAENDMGRKSITLLFSKTQTIAEIEIIEWTATSWLVTVNFLSDP